jgi:hypothetical protein
MIPPQVIFRGAKIVGIVEVEKILGLNFPMQIKCMCG